MSDDGAERTDHVVWKRLSQDRPWYRRLASQNLAEAQVDTPNGDTYLVRVARNAPVVGVADAVASGNPITGAAGLARANLHGGEDTGWTISVLKPSTPWRSERPLYRQHVGAEAIVVDVTLAITNALSRGDTLWE